MIKDNENDMRGVLRSIAWRPANGVGMTEIEKCTVLAKRGLDLENRKHGKREVTLLSVQSWKDVCREIGKEIPWYIRRANFLIDGIDLALTIGKTLTIGSVRVHIYGETKPCNLMDEQCNGLRAVLRSDCRGGVHGQVLNDGEIQTGNPVFIST